MFLKNGKEKRKLRVRKHVFGTAERPRLAVYRSNKYIYGQIINDESGATLIDIQNETKKIHTKGTKIEAAFEAGKELAKKAKDKKITQVVFDKSHYKYHGRVKSFADGAREGGLQF